MVTASLLLTGFVLTAEDARAIGGALLVLLCLAGLAVWQRRRIAALLTPREWRLFGKLWGCLVLAVLLVLFDVALQLPAEMFIYGRF